MKNLKFKQLNTTYKISIISMVVVLCSVITTVIFVLLPIYGLVGDSSITTSEANSSLDKSESLSEVFNSVTIIAAATSLVSGGYGAYKDVRKKPKV